jgi:signal peptidase II
MTRWLGLSALVVVLDQATKFLIKQALTLGQGIELTPFFNIVLVYNRGAAFSFLSDAGGWQRAFFIGIALVAVVWIVYLLRKHADERLFCLALGLVLGGAIGNLIDRVLYGSVVDFLDVHAAGYHWPAFNVADSAISCGAVLLVWESFRPANREGAEAQSNAKD